VAVGEHAADRAEVAVTPAEVDNVDAVLHDRDCLETGPQLTASDGAASPMTGFFPAG
jgi:hypothetical protein